ncbi:MAG: hypothetical protein QE280_06500 [Caulobacter sp.]|nr:hypothetical protein [Caulobacter sp.]
MTLHFPAFPIPKASAIGFSPRRLVHRLLTVAAGSGGLTFESRALDKPIDPSFDIEAFVRTLAGKASSGGKRPEPPIDGGENQTPFDIEVTEQCYVVLELDLAVNWRFREGSMGVSTKLDCGDSNFGLAFVDESGEVQQDRVPADCRLLWFSVAERRPPSRQGFNLDMVFQFASADPAVTRALPTLFDPDIPSSGGSSFP